VAADTTYGNGEFLQWLADFGRKQYREIPGLCSSEIPAAFTIDGCSEVP